MADCEHCGSNDVRWFTPPRTPGGAAVLLCMGCRRLTIVSPHALHSRRTLAAGRAA